MTTHLLRRPRLRVPTFAAALIALAPAGAVAAEGAGTDPFSGTYGVIGTTVDSTTGDTRRIEGHLVLTLKNGLYAAASELSTEFPSHGGPMHADVIGSGDGKRTGERLSGTAKTQLVIQTVPGVDPNFAFIPRKVGPRIVSSWKAHIDPDGTLVVELVNKPEPGEDYRQTTTTLRGKRVPTPDETAQKP